MSSSPIDYRFYSLRDAMFNNWEVAQALIEADPTIIEARSGIGETALHYLAVENHLEGVAYLLERGAHINTRNDFQGTPLIDAASLGYLELCRFLLDNGADITSMDDIGKTAIGAAFDLTHSDNALLQMLLFYKGDADINLFFDDSDAQFLLTYQNAQISDFWRALGLRSRYDDEETD